MFINIHTHHVSPNKEVIDLINYFPKDVETTTPYFSVGLHPWHIDEKRLAIDLELVEKHLQNPHCFALGEIGLDKITSVNFSLQYKVFRKQLQLATKYNKPVIIHCIRAFQEILNLRKKEQIQQPFIFHGYSKNQQLLDQIYHAGCFVSFGKILLVNTNLQAIFANLKNEVFFLENDNSNEPIESIYKQACSLQEIPLDELKQQIAQNWKHIFGPL